MRKKTVFGILPVVVLVITFGAFMCFSGIGTASADNNQCGANLTWTLNAAGTLTISGSGEMEDYNSYECDPAPWNEDRDNITNVVIDSGVTSIGDFAFCECRALESITIPDSVTSIGDYAFSSCESLESVTIPEGVTEISDCAFYNCGSMADITIPASVTSIGSGAFIYCYGLNNVCYAGSEAQWNAIVIRPDNNPLSSAAMYFDGESLPTVSADSLSGGNLSAVNAGNSCGANLTWTLDAAGTLTISGSGKMHDYSSTALAPWYEHRDSITNVVIDSGVTSIGCSAFLSCTALEDVMIPESVTSIDAYAFLFCGALENITIPESVTNIGDYAFNGCGKLSDVYYAGSEAQWNAITIGANNDPLTGAKIHFDGESQSTVNANNQCGENVTWTLDAAGTLTISGSGEMYDYDNYGDHAAPWCEDRYKITNVVIDSGVTSIGVCAFSFCEYLESVTIPDSVTNIGSYAFSVCNALESVTIPDSVTSIGNGAFAYCALERVTIPEGVTEISDCAFYNCGSMADITIPVSVTSIGSGAFIYCYELNNVCYAGSEAQWNAIVIRPDNAPLSSAAMYFDGESLPAVSADSLPAVNAGNSCGGNLTWTLDESGTLTISGSGKMHDYDRAMDHPAPWYEDRDNITKVVIDSGVMRIGNDAFSNCESLESVTIPDGVTNIGSYAFSGCGALESVTIPAGVTEIGESAFIYCDKLSDVYYAGSEAQWNTITVGANNGPLTGANIHFNAA